MGLQWTDVCYCGNTYGSQGTAPATSCDTGGLVPTGDFADLCAQGLTDSQCGGRNAVYTVDASASMQIGTTRLAGSLMAWAAGEPWEINPPTLLADAMGVLRPYFVVRSGPCTVVVVDGNSCVGRRLPSGYLPNEDCEIAVPLAGAGGAIGPCPVFDTEECCDYLTLPDGGRHGG